MPSLSKLAFVSACGLASAVQLHGLNRQPPIASSGLEEYEPGTGKGHLHDEQMRSAAPPGDAPSGPAPSRHSAEWYVMRCNEINSHCKFLAEHRIAAAKRDRQYLKDECQRQKNILAHKEEVHAGEKSDVRQQEDIVAQKAVQVADAKKVVGEFSHCPGDLGHAKSELSRLEAIPNKSPADIDDECKWQQKKLEAEKCVERLRAAEAVLENHQSKHAQESAELAHEETHVSPAKRALPPQEQKVEDACAKWKALEATPVPPAASSILANCQAERDDLLRRLGDDTQTLDDECARQKRILSGKVEVHKEEKVDHSLQKDVVAAKQAKVAKAEATVKEFAHCPPELEDAKADLARLEADPNTHTDHIDEECEVHQRILEAEKCVDQLRDAEEVLAHREEVHSAETGELHEESQEAWAAKQAVPPQKAIVKEVCADLDAAKSRWEAAHAACRAPNEHP